jgi:succinoglycan biosynthesis protein ExoO
VSRQRIVGETNGSSSYVLSIVDYLTKRGLEVHYVCPTPMVFGRWPFLRLRKEMAIFASYHIRGSFRIGSFVVNPSVTVLGRALLALLDLLVTRAGWSIPRFSRQDSRSFFSPPPLNEADRAYLCEVAANRAEAILCDYANTTPAIEAIGRPGAPTAVVMHDLFSALHPEVEEATELSLLSKAGLVIAIQKDEAKLVEERLPGQLVAVAPMAISPVRDPAPGDPDKLLFVGSHTFSNIEALNWFVDHVWPILHRWRSTLTLDVAGTVSRGIGRVPTGIRLLGLVPDLEALYRQAGIVISPLRSGTGLKIKLIEAMSYGKAVVATPVTVQGVENLVTGIVSVADDQRSFAEQIVRLASDEAERRRVGERAIFLVRDHFNAERCYGPVYNHLTRADVTAAPVTEHHKQLII